MKGLAFTYDNMMFAALVDFHQPNNTKLLFYDVDTRQEVDSIVVHSASHSFCFTPDGKTVVVAANIGDRETTLSVWDLKTRKLQKTINVTYVFGEINVALDNKTLYAIGLKKTLRCNLETGKYTTFNTLDRFTSHSPSPDGKLFAISSSRECKVVVYDTVTGKSLRTFDYPVRRFNGGLLVTFSPDNKTVAILWHNLWDPRYKETSELTLYRLSDGKAIRRIPLPDTWNEGIHFLKDGNTIVVRGKKKAKEFSTSLPGFYLVRIDTGEIVAPLGQGKSYSPLKSAVSSDGKLLLLANEDLRLWSLKEKK